MALRINLYHEIQQQERARRRDPLKLGMLGLLIIAVGFVAYYLCRLGHVHEVNVRVAALEAQWRELDPKQQAAKTRQEELNANIKTSEALVKRIEGRFYWAPLFAQLLQSATPSVQFTKLTASGEVETGKSVNIALNGISSGDEPRQTAEDLRTALGEKFGETFKKVESSFRSLDESDETVPVNGQRVPTANFNIEFNLQNEPAAAPAAARTKKVAAQ